MKTNSRYWFGNFSALSVVVLASFLIVAVGCQKDHSTDEADSTVLDSTGQWSDHDFAFAVDNLQRLERYSGGEMRQQMVDRLNQWVRQKELPADWKVDPLVATLPKPLAEGPEMDSLEKMVFSNHDGYALQEAVWLRDASSWTQGEHGDQADKLTRAENIFDWIVRDIQLMPDAGDKPEQIAQYPWETLLWGQGTALDRAWVFILMLRQQDIDAVLLALPSTDDKDEKKLDPWAVGVLIDKKLYLFDPALGLPIPGPDGVKYEDKRLVIQPATLSQVVKNPKLLRELDIPGHPYPVDEKRLAGVVALVEASPSYLTGRMRLIESQMTGDQRVVLTTSPSKVIKRLKDIPNLAECRLWTWPYEQLALRNQMSDTQKKKLRAKMYPFEIRHDTPLWKGRVLYLKGKFTDEQGAMAYFLKARPPKRVVAAMKRLIAEEKDPKRIERMKKILAARIRGKSDATYWIGLVEVAEGRPTVAADYFSMRLLLKPWQQGARYNLARVAESVGQTDVAAKIYRAAPPSPVKHGMMLRAKWLEPSNQDNDSPSTEKSPKDNAETSE